MEDLLSIAKTKKITHPGDAEQHITLAHKEEELDITPTEIGFKQQPASPDEVLKVLQNKPSFEILRSHLKWLSKAQDGFQIKVPSPLATQINNALVNEVLPNYWSVLKEGHQKELNLFLKVLTSVAGLGALTTRLRGLLNPQSGSPNAKALKTEKKQNVNECLEILAKTLYNKTTLRHLWKGIQENIEKPIQRRLLWKELIALLASSKLLSLIAEALLYLGSNDENVGWLGEGRLYTKWLGANIKEMIEKHVGSGDEAYNSGAQMLGKALLLGYNGSGDYSFVLY
jgi:telomere length regulation protein